MTIRKRWQRGLATGALGQVVKRASWAFFFKLGGAACSLLFNMLLARWLGATQAGTYYLAVSITSIAVVFSRLGLDNVVLRYVSVFFSEENTLGIMRVRKTTSVLVGSLAVGVAVVLVTWSGFVSTTIFPDNALGNYLRIMSLAIVPSALYNMNSYFLQGTGRILRATFLQSLALPLFLLTSLTLLYVLRVANAGGGAYSLAAVIVFLLSVVFGWRTMPKRTLSTSQGDGGTLPTLRDLLRAGFSLFLVSSMTLVITWTDTVSLGVWGTTAEVGIYNMALRVAALVSFTLSAFNSVLAPRMAVLNKRRDLLGLAMLVRRSTVVMTAVSLPFFLICVVVPQWILGQIGGVTYQTGSVALACLAIGQFISVVSGPVLFTLMMTGREVSVRNITLVAVGMNLILNLILVPLWKMNGAALATCFTDVVINLLGVLTVYKKLGIVTLPRINWRRQHG